MATSGIVQTRTYYDFQVKLAWELTSQDDVNNTSTISWVLTGENQLGISQSYSLTIESLTIDGVSKISNQYYTFSTISSYQLASGTMTIEHNHDGTRIFPVVLKVLFQQPGSGARYSASNSFTLTPISKVSTLSIPDFYATSGVKITINRKGTTYADSLYYKIVGETGDYHSIIGYLTQPSFNWIGLNTASLQYLPTDRDYIEVEFLCKTYDTITGSYALIGESTLTVKAFATYAQLVPKIFPNSTFNISYAYDNTNTLTGATDKGILNYSKIGIRFNPVLEYGATIVSKKITLAGEVNTQVDQQNRYVFQPLAANKFTYEAVDSRGYVLTGTYDLTVINYLVPTISLNVVPPSAVNGDTTVKVSGKAFNGSFGSTTNVISVRYGYKESGANSFTYVTLSPTQTNNKYSATGTIALDYTKTYVFVAEIADSVNTTYIATEEQIIHTQPLIEWDKSTIYTNVITRARNHIVLDNEIAIEGKKHTNTGSNYYLLRVNSSDEVNLGTTYLPLTIQASSTIAANQTINAPSLQENGVELSNKYFAGTTTYVSLGNGSASSSTSKTITDNYNCGCYVIIFKVSNKFWSVTIPQAWATGNYFIYCATSSNDWGWKIAKSNTTLTISTDQSTSANFYLYGIR